MELFGTSVSLSNSDMREFSSDLVDFVTSRATFCRVPKTGMPEFPSDSNNFKKSDGIRCGLLMVEPPWRFILFGISRSINRVFVDRGSNGLLPGSLEVLFLLVIEERTGTFGFASVRGFCNEFRIVFVVFRDATS